MIAIIDNLVDSVLPITVDGAVGEATMVRRKIEAC
jgi:hypothetical protein